LYDGHMKTVSFALALLCGSPLILWCQDSSNLLTEAREAMRGLLGVSVETDHNGCAGIVDKELTKQDIEVKLRIAGIRITQLPIAVLGMMANCLPVENAGRRISTIVHFSLLCGRLFGYPRSLCV
jgi:hypothetical protein